VPRLVSGVLLAPIALGAVWLGGWFLAAVAGLALLVAFLEFLRMGAGAGYRMARAPGVAAVAALWLAATGTAGSWSPLVLWGAALWLAFSLLRRPIIDRVPGVAMTLFGVAYVGGLGTYFLLLRDLHEGERLLMLVLVATWAADIAAFGVGVRWGRRRLAPHISPGKSVEGAIGGLLGAVLGTAVAWRILCPGRFSAVEILGVGAALGVTAVLGDLVESVIKRNLKVKDASRVIPGHGGVLDRIDSLLFTVPMAYYLFRHLLRHP